MEYTKTREKDVKASSFPRKLLKYNAELNKSNPKEVEQIELAQTGIALKHFSVYPHRYLPVHDLQNMAQ